jgi:hypothetical protein
VIVVLVFTVRNRGYELDDALIYYRYLQNCLAGDGLVYNVGERFNALTSPLYTYLALVVCGLAGSIHYPMIAVSAVLTALTAVLLFVLFRRHEPLWPLVLFGAVLVAALRYSYSVYGMETPLFLALAVSCLLLHERRQIGWLAVAGGLLVLTRAEGLLLLVVLAAAHLLRRRPLPPVRVFVAPLLLLGANAAFNAWYYGSPWPHTLMAKIQQGRSGLWGEGWIFFFQTGYQLEYFAGSRLLLVASLTLALLGIVRLGRRELNVVLLAFLAALTVFYVALHVPSYHWYYAPYYVFGCMYAGLGLAELFERASRLTSPVLARAGRVLIGLLGAVLLGSHAWATATRPVSDTPRQRVYPLIGRWLAANTPPEATVAMLEVGIIGYYSERRVVDILGLVSPGNAETLGQRRFGAWLESYAPDFILVHSPLWPHEQGVVAHAERGTYRLVASFPFPGFALLARARESP